MLVSRTYSTVAASGSSERLFAARVGEVRSKLIMV